jgi:FKBP-type peptidyl-prolyl cis-trans isomerase
MPIKRPLFLSAFLLATVIAVPQSHAQRERLPYDDLVIVEQRWPNAQKTSESIRYVIEKPGSGDLAVPGDWVTVLYEGKLLNGKMFDHNMDAAHAFRFRVGRGLVIQGWDQVLQLMKPGEKRLVVIPPELAYGSKGDAPNIPRDATLVFEIELLKIEHADYDSPSPAVPPSPGSKH